LGGLRVNVQLVLKSSGSLAVIAAGFLAGRMAAQRLSRRLSVLEDLRAAVERLGTEISYSQAPLPEALSSVAHSCRPECQGLLRDVSANLRSGDGGPAGAAWLDALSTWGRESDLLPQDIDAISLLGPALGVSGPADQLGHIASTVSRLGTCIEEARARRSKFFGFYQEMGVLFAALVVLVLL